MEVNTADDPAPPTARNSTARAKFGARPVSSEDTSSTARPAAAVARSPYRSTTGPDTTSNSSRDTANIEMSSPAAPYPTPKDRAYRGRIGATIPYPSIITNTAPTATRTAGSARIPSRVTRSALALIGRRVYVRANWMVPPGQIAEHVAGWLERSVTPSDWTSWPCCWRGRPPRPGPGGGSRSRAWTGRSVGLIWVARWARRCSTGCSRRAGWLASRGPVRCSLPGAAGDSSAESSGSPSGDGAGLRGEWPHPSDQVDLHALVGQADLAAVLAPQLLGPDQDGLQVVVGVQRVVVEHHQPAGLGQQRERDDVVGAGMPPAHLPRVLVLGVLGVVEKHVGPVGDVVAGQP